MRKLVIAALASALFGPAIADSPPLTISNLVLEPEIGRTNFREPAYEVSYTIENTGDLPVEYLKVVVLGRNAEGRIVERQDSQTFYRGSLPGGLAPGDSIVERHGLLVTNPAERVEAIEVRVSEFRLVQADQ